MRRFSALFAVAVLLLSLGLHVAPAYALGTGTLRFTPTSDTKAVGGTFTIAVEIATGTQEIQSADAFINFDSNLLEYQNTTAGGFFDTVAPTLSGSRLYIGGIFEQGTSKTKSGTGTMATVTFRAKNNGTASLSFNCGQSGSGAQNSAIIPIAPDSDKNIINCGGNGTATLTIGSGGGSGTPTPTPTTSTGGGSSSPTPTPTTSAGGSTNPTSTPKPTAKPTAVTKLPQSGVAENLPAYTVIGGMLLLLGVGARFLL